MIVTKIPLCMFARYGTRGAVIAAQRPCVLKKINSLGAIARGRASVRTLRAYPARRLRLGVTAPYTPIETTTSDTSIQYLPDIPYIQSPYSNYPNYPGAPGGQVTYVAPQYLAPAIAQQQQQPPAVPPSPIISGITSWLSGASIAGIPNSIIAGGFSLIVGASLLKSRGRAR